jgi:hypothetical protein
MKTEKLKKVFQWGMAIITAIMVMSCIVMIFNERYIHALVYLTAAIAYLTTFKYVVDALARITHGMFAKKLPEFQGSLDVHEIDSDARKLHFALGISRERGEEIFDVVIRITKEVKEDFASRGSWSLATVLERCSKHVNHPNELALMTTIAQSVFDQERSPIGGILAGIFGK